jgi:hypothetical protein
MTARLTGTDFGLRRRAAAGFLGCLLLTVCAAPETTTRWVKTGSDEATTAREVQACRAQANAVLGTQIGINEDITATLGGNWQRSSTMGIESASLNRSAAGAADRAFENCMLAKGFVKGT